ncbi:MAG: 16S rRNA (cytosine(967)-C(5))-methyltransferase RsmB [Gemmatimonadaceae bacterium]
MHQARRPPSAARASAITESRRVATDILADLRTGALLDSSFERHAGRIDARDRRWTQELVYGMLRRRSWLDSVLEERVRGGLARLESDLVDLLRLGAYQLLFMGSVPAYAAIAQTVELAKERHGVGAGGLANAVLRRLDRERDDVNVAAPGDPIEALALAHSHPGWLVARWVAQFGAEEATRLLESNNIEAPTVLRPFGIVREQLEAKLESAGIGVASVPLAAESIQITTPVSLSEWGPYNQGLFYVQDPGSTLVTMYASVPAGATVADLCAAPGGKSLELARTAGVVFAADRSIARMTRLRSNIGRVDVASPLVLVADARQPPIKAVDMVLVDAPCTGTGTFRRHPDARWRLKVSDLAVTAALQSSILRAAAEIVKPGGLLVYSTCSLEPEENDVQIERFLGENAGWELEPPPSGAVHESVLDVGLLRVLPQRHGIDGAFAARLRRSRA